MAPPTFLWQTIKALICSVIGDRDSRPGIIILVVIASYFVYQMERDFELRREKQQADIAIQQDKQRLEWAKIDQKTDEKKMDILGRLQEKIIGARQSMMEKGMAPQKIKDHAVSGSILGVVQASYGRERLTTLYESSPQFREMMGEFYHLLEHDRSTFIHTLDEITDEADDASGVTEVGHQRQRRGKSHGF